jgi:hypothetical protein
MCMMIYLLCRRLAGHLDRSRLPAAEQSRSRAASRACLSAGGGEGDADEADAQWGKAATTTAEPQPPRYQPCSTTELRCEFTKHSLSASSTDESLRQSSRADKLLQTVSLLTASQKQLLPAENVMLGVDFLNADAADL